MMHSFRSLSLFFDAESHLFAQTHLKMNDKNNLSFSSKQNTFAYITTYQATKKTSINKEKKETISM